MDQDEKKQRVAEAALAAIDHHLLPDAVLGIGTGSTANRFIDALAGERHRFHGCVSSSQASADRLQGHGIRVLDLNDAPPLRVYVDGADEADTDLALIKGGGGAHTREKIVAASADQFICIVDDSKCVERLGAFPLPIEVIPMATALVRRTLHALGGAPILREGFLTDNGNVILDTTGLDLSAPAEVESRLNDITGVVSNGLFALRPADLLLIATDQGVESRTR